MKAPGHGVRRRRARQGPAAGARWTATSHTEDDNGGVHLNSGIPNHAFYLLATALGGNAWERAGQIWYDTLTGGELQPRASFADFARLTVAAARTRYGSGEEQEAVTKAWSTVGVPTAG